MKAFSRCGEIRKEETYRKEEFYTLKEKKERNHYAPLRVVD